MVIHIHHIEPRGGVTVLAQATAGAFGTGWPFYVSNIAVAAVLGLAANTSFGGLPVLMSLLARDHRLPHAFYLRAERPVYRIGILVLAGAALLLLLAVSARTDKLIPLFTIGVFVGFTHLADRAGAPLASRAAGPLAAAGGGQRRRSGDDGGRGGGAFWPPSSWPARGWWWSRSRC